MTVGIHTLSHPYPILDPRRQAGALLSKSRGLQTVVLYYLSSDSQTTSGAHAHVAVGRKMRAIFWKNNLDIYHFVS